MTSNTTPSLPSALLFAYCYVSSYQYNVLYSSIHTREPCSGVWITTTPTTMLSAPTSACTTVRPSSDATSLLSTSHSATAPKANPTSKTMGKNAAVNITLTVSNFD